MKHKKKKVRPVNELYCPYCGARAKLVPATVVYGNRTIDPDEKMYVCGNFEKGCDAYVTTHKGTDIPRGSLANGDLRHKRILAHRAIKKVIDSGIMTKKQIYRYLEVQLNFRKNKFHIGESSYYYCQETIDLMNDLLKQSSKVKHNIA